MEVYTIFGHTRVPCLLRKMQSAEFALHVVSLSPFLTLLAQHLRTLTGHTGGVWCSQFDGATVVSGSTDRNLRVSRVQCHIHIHVAVPDRNRILFHCIFQPHYRV